jgi:hypothetical protein
MWACATLGWCDETHVPWDDARAAELSDLRRNAWLNAAPTAAQRRHAYDQAHTVDYAYLHDSDVERAIRETVGNGRYPIVFGADVGEDYLHVSTWDPCDVDAGEFRGGHAQVITGYDAQGVHVLNSWAGWGVADRARVSWACARRAFRDLFAIRRVVRPTS